MNSPKLDRKTHFCIQTSNIELFPIHSSDKIQKKDRTVYILKILNKAVQIEVKLSESSQ